MTPPDPPAVSVVLPTYNRADRVQRAVDSVLRQTSGDLELIVVDDASTDDTVRRLEAVGDPRLTVVRSPARGGGGAARNRGLRRARADWVAFQDSDDVWRPTKLERQLERLRRTPEAAAVYCRYRRTVGGREEVCPARTPLPEGDLTRALAEGSFIGTPTLMARRAALDEIGGFVDDLPRLQDWELLLRLADGRVVVAVDEVLVDAADSADGISGGHDRALLDAERRIVETHRARFAAAGTEILARRLWHLGHVHCMGGHVDDGRRFLAEAVDLQPTWRHRVSLALSRNRHLYARCYAVYRALV